MSLLESIKDGLNTDFDKEVWKFLLFEKTDDEIIEEFIKNSLLDFEVSHDDREDDKENK